MSRSLRGPLPWRPWPPLHIHDEIAFRLGSVGHVVVAHQGPDVETLLEHGRNAIALLSDDAIVEATARSGNAVWRRFGLSDQRTTASRTTPGADLKTANPGEDETIARRMT
jgi:hypothetical protein